MGLLAKIILFFLFFVTIVTNFDLDNLRPVSRNKVSLEKFICKYQPGSKIDKKYKCLVKYIDRNHVKFDIHGTLTEPISSLKIRLMFYYKYTTYQRIGGDFNINVCSVFTMKEKLIPALQWCFAIADKFSNINHTCPYSGYVFAKADNASINEFAYPEMMPAGRYRIDGTVFEDHDRILFNTSLYFSISDHRIDVSYSKV